MTRSPRHESSTGASRFAGERHGLAFTRFVFLIMLAVSACGSCPAQPPEPFVVLENPTTHERINFYREVPFKVAANYDEKKHIAEWKAEQAAKGFTKVVKE